MSDHPGPLTKQHFLLRRLHSLTGIVPIGVFLIMHLTTNSTIAWGGLNTRADQEGYGWFDRAIATFQHEVSFINETPLLLLIEITLWASIAFHSILGVAYAMSGRPNNADYKYGGNARYTLQRLTGYFGIFFIFYHVATLRWGWSWLPGAAEWSHHNAASTMAHAIQGSTEGLTATGLVVSIFYFVGVSGLVFHFANGLWTAAITWGLTISRAAQRRWGYACAGLGAGLMVLAWASVVGFATLDYEQARSVEEAMHVESLPVDPSSHTETADSGAHTNTDG